MRRVCSVAVALVVLLSASLAPAAPPRPNLAREIREGKRAVPEYLRELREKGPPKYRGDRQAGKVLRDLKRRLREGGDPRSLPAPGVEPFDGTVPALTSPAPPAWGSPNVLTLLASFTDVPPSEAAAYFDSLVFGGTSPSVSHYYREVSAESFTIVTEDPPSGIQCTPFVGPCTPETPPGWLPLPQTKAVYRTSLRTMLQDAVAASDDAVDFSRYDNDGDGLVDYLILVHTGTGGEWTGNNNDIWSQTVTVAPVATADGVSIDTFMTVPEYWSFPWEPMTIGVYVHEFGHLLGLGDLYDLFLDSKGIGDWGLMGLGTWNGTSDSGESPAWLSAWSRVALGWVAPEVPLADTAGVHLPPVEQAGPGRGGPVYYLWDHGSTGSTEFFLIENRQQLAGTYDEHLPGHGLLVWHVDETMPDNNTQIPPSDPLRHYDCNWPSHYRVALQQADGNMNLEQGSSNDGDRGDPYPGSFGITAFSPTSTGDFPPRTPPNSGSYADCDSRVAVRSIAEIGTDIWLDLEVSGPPELVVDSYRSLTSPLPGSDVPLTVTLANVGGGATGISATLSSLDPLVAVIDAAASYPPIPHGGTGTNDGEPFLVRLDAALVPGTAVGMELQVTADGGYLDTLPFELFIGAPGGAPVLLVRADVPEGADIVALEWEENLLQGPFQRGDLSGEDDIYLRGDVNGDGLRDLVRGRVLDPDTVEWGVHLARLSPSGIYYEDSPGGIWHADLGSGRSLFFLGDADGDGLEDLVYTEATGREPWLVDLWVALSDGASFGSAARWSAGLPLSPSTVILVGDVDGDGRSDLVNGFGADPPATALEWRVALSDGVSFRPWEGWGLTAAEPFSDFHLGDVDGDARTDLVFSLSSSGPGAALDWMVALSDGVSFAEESLWLEGFGHLRQKFGLAEVDGNRRADLLAWSVQGGDWVFDAFLSEGGSFSPLGEVGRFRYRGRDLVLP